MNKRHDPPPGCYLPPACEHRCEDIPRELPHYFSGRLLTARDMRDEQAFFLARLRLRNLLFHGWGVVCGLDICPHPDPACRDRFVVLKPGIAIDCCGREILVCEPERICIPKVPKPDPCPPPGKTPPKPTPPKRDIYGYLQKPSQRAAEPAAEAYPHPQPEPDWGPYVVCLHYLLEGTEQRPVLDDPCGCDPERTAPSRMRERFAIKIVHQDELGPDCWPNAPEGKDCKGKGHGDIDCFAPDCPCGDCVPLAVLTYGEDGPRIDQIGRPAVINTLRRHTTICAINWDHGAAIKADDLVTDMDGALRITFSEPIAERDDARGTGISRFTFEVQYTGVQLDSEYFACDGEPYLDADRCTAVYPIGKSTLKKIRQFCNNDFRVLLRGDFVLDAHGHPVDVDFLRGQMPTGNGIAGGLFQSWFSLEE
ncbi:MAG: hypothetical protein AAF675_13060 [Pseudomonadota bacterium]